MRLVAPGQRPIRRQIACSLALICSAILLVAGLVFNQVLEAQARYLVNTRARVLMDLMLSVRDYTADFITPVMDPINKRNDVFQPAAVPSFAAQQVFRLFEQRLDGAPGLTYREPALNPTDPADRADPFEASLIERFRASPALSEITGDRTVQGKPIHYVAHPIRVDSVTCLECHSTPERAPQSQLARYGSTGGFGWTLNEVVGAQVLSVPQRDIFALHDQSLAVTAVLFISSFGLLIIIVNAFLDQQVLVPLLDVARGLRSIRSGSFDLHLSTRRTDELGGLLNDLDYTAHRLEGLIESETSMAMKTLQLDTARAIHRCFLVKHLPQGNGLMIAADSRPALDVGADWYDAFVVGDLTFILVADVCDKGVGSALFMSVFRSLIHFSLQAAEIRSPDDVARVLTDVMTRVNDYMATNHDDMMMFATVFVGAYDAATHRCTFVNAGHELPLLIGPDGLCPLAVTGPAVGVFAGGSFRTTTLTLEPGSILFAYTDGLTDARSPSDEAWGSARLRASLERHYAPTLSAAELIGRVEQDVAAHVAGADPFDDLTMLAMKVTTPTPAETPVIPADHADPA